MVNNKPRIFILCPSSNKPVGGIKQIYRHADILNKNGFSAFVLHQKKGFRCTWFDNCTKVAYKANLRNRSIKKRPAGAAMTAAIKQFMLSPIFNPFYSAACLIKFVSKHDYRSERMKSFRNNLSKIIARRTAYADANIKTTDFLVIPQVYGPEIVNIEKGVRKVILNQNPFYIFKDYPRDNSEMKTAYFDKEVIATIVFSDFILSYMKCLFPQLRLFRARYGFDPALFGYCSQKKKQIAFMPRKFANDATQIINILKAWGAVKDFKLVEIDNMEEKKVAEILRESLIFLSLSHREGFGMPSAEAMACGCIVIGYDGKGGREFFKEEFCYPVEQDNLIGFAQTVKKVIEEYEMNKEIFLEKGRMASEFILTAYSLKREEEDVVRVWQEILKG